MTPAALVHVVADALAVDASVITQHDQRLAKADLRTKRGRGPSAAIMQAQDAAALVLAVLAGVTVGSRRDGRMVDNMRDLLNSQIITAVPKDVPALPKFRVAVDEDYCTLADALTAFIEDAMTGHVEAVLGKKAGDLNAGFRLLVERPDAIATMQFDPGGEFHFAGLSDNEEPRQITVTAAISALPLVRIAGKLRA